jgi:predicted RNA methylase
MTPPNVAAQLLYYVYLHEPVDSMLVADLGVGTGMLSCGLVYIGSLFTFGVELDTKYVCVARDQLEEKVEGGLFDLVNANVAQLRLRKQVDLVVMNPPFGTK